MISYSSSRSKIQNLDVGQQRTVGSHVATRRGSVLLAVLAIVALLSLAAWAFCDSMVSENTAVSAHARQIERTLIVDSGVAWTQARLSVSNRVQKTESTEFDSLFVDSTVYGSGWDQVAVADRGEFTVAHQLVTAEEFVAQSGPYDLSGLININALRDYDADLGRETARGFLLALPNMTVITADSILDFVADPANVNASMSSSSLLSSTSVRDTRQRPMTNLNLLLRVPGVGVDQLFGEDVNQNGLLDDDEDQNDDGRLQTGWAAYLTVVNGESNLRSDGGRKIDLNQQSLSRLYNEVSQALGPRTAQYVVAFRMNGALSDLSAPTAAETSVDAVRRAAEERGRLQRGELPDNDSSDSDSSRKQVVTSADLARGGLDLSVGPVFRIESLMDLFGTSVRTLLNGQDTVLSAPWSSDATTVFQQLPQLHAQLSVSDEATTAGRINVFVAPDAVLTAIPGITWRMADDILNARDRMVQPPGNIAWLLDQGIVTFEQLRDIAPFITAGGDYFRATVIARITPASGGRQPYAFSLSGSAVTIDATKPVPRLVSHRLMSAGECRVWNRSLVNPDTSSRRMATGVSNSIRQAAVPRYNF